VDSYERFCHPPNDMAWEGVEAGIATPHAASYLLLNGHHNSPFVFAPCLNPSSRERILISPHQEFNEEK
jgi:hypothetical protein